MKNFVLNIKTLGLAVIALLSLMPKNDNAQTVNTRFQQNIRGGFAIASNCLVDAPPADNGFGDYGQKLVNTAGGATMSSYADLILPTGSTIAKAFLYVEGYSASDNAITSVKFKVSGGAYTTLTTASAGFLSNSIASAAQAQFIIDVTSLMPATGYVSTVVAGGEATGAGRYSVADIATFDASNYGYGWSLIVVYTNPSARYRNVTICDVNSVFGGTGCGALGSCTVTFNVNGISVPSAGAYNATVAFTGTYGNDGTNDIVQFGKAGGALTNLKDPTTNSSADMYNSTIGVCANNNVTVDAALAGSPIAMSGNVTTRNPSSFTDPLQTNPSWYSYFYDCDIVDASGILPNSATPINVTFTQNSNSGDVIGGGTYVVAIDIVSAVVTKSLAPSSIVQGGTATYSWKIDNSLAGGLNLAGIGFTDNLPANIIVATPPNASIVGGSGSTITAAAGGTSVKLAGLTLNAGQIATMKVDVTNKPGQLNADCSTNPLAFTNGFVNVTGLTANLANSITNQCLIVTATVPIELTSFSGKIENNKNVLNWTTLSEENNNYFEIERSRDGINFSKIGNDIQGSGTTSMKHDYVFLDPNPNPGSNYYRLKQVDFNNRFVYSSIISVNSTLKSLNISNVQWQGNALLFNVLSTNSTSITASLFDVSGRRVQYQSYNLSGSEGATSAINMNTEGLETGIYFLEVESSNTTPQQVKILKVNGF